MKKNIFYFGRMKPFLNCILIVAIFSFIHKPATAQHESFYVFDSSWTGTTIEKARYLLRVHSLSDTCWQYDYYNFTGPLIRTEQYRDKQGEVLHGATRYYNEKGRLDSTGNYRKGKMNGQFYKLKHGSDTLRFWMKYVYEDNQLVETTDLQKQPRDTTKYADEKESEFPGGISRWGYFLTKNLKYPDRAINGNYEGTVHITFTVDTEGQVHDPYISKSVEYSLDAESMRMIKKSGKWTPAFQNGKNVKTYKIQPITFRLQ
jgi:protein TonB